jgi:hypothetical protein
MPKAIWSDFARDDLKKNGRYIGRQQNRPSNCREDHARDSQPL